MKNTLKYFAYSFLFLTGIAMVLNEKYWFLGFGILGFWVAWTGYELFLKGKEL